MPSDLEIARASYRPRLPEILAQGAERIAVEEVEHLPAFADAGDIAERFPRTYGRPLVRLADGTSGVEPRPRVVGVVLSGGQAPGGHNVISGLLDGLLESHPESRLIGFLGGPRGIVTDRTRELDLATVKPYRNTGGFDLIGSGRDKIETREQFEASRATCERHGLDGLVIVGGDDSNTNAAVLAEFFLERGVRASVVGVPKTIDGDLKNDHVEASFGFDTATRVYAELIGNICRDAKSAGKYWHFIKLMGRSASHVTLECALATRPNLALIGEEIEERRLTLEQIVERIVAVVLGRAAQGRRYGVCLVPEGLIEFVPEMRALIGELNGVLAARPLEFETLEKAADRVEYVACKLRPATGEVFRRLPDRIRTQLLLDRDAHGNVQVSKIDTERLLIEQVAGRIADLDGQGRGPGGFSVQGHFFGYEGRAAAPTNFDADYAYALGRVAAALIGARRTGYMCAIGNLVAAPEAWTVAGIPLTSMMGMEMRQGRWTPVIAKALVRTDRQPFTTFAESRDAWAIEDAYVYPGAIQYFGPAVVSRSPTRTLLLERTGSADSPDWLTETT